MTVPVLVLELARELTPGVEARAPWLAQDPGQRPGQRRGRGRGRAMVQRAARTWAQAGAVPQQPGRCRRRQAAVRLSSGAARGAASGRRRTDLGRASARSWSVSAVQQLPSHARRRTGRGLSTEEPTCHTTEANGRPRWGRAMSNEHSTSTEQQTKPNPNLLELRLGNESCDEIYAS